jgi:hypothetical protein
MRYSIGTRHQICKVAVLRNLKMTFCAAVIFIVACGLTHVVHLWSAFTGIRYLEAQVIMGMITAIASVGTAIAFAFVSPQLQSLPSPRRQRAELEEMVAVRTAEKDRLLREINHRVGNQLQVMGALVRLEKNRTQSSEVVAILSRLEVELAKMNERHHSHSRVDYLGPLMEDDKLPIDSVIQKA